MVDTCDDVGATVYGHAPTPHKVQSTLSLSGCSAGFFTRGLKNTYPADSQALSGSQHAAIGEPPEANVRHGVSVFSAAATLPQSSGATAAEDETAPRSITRIASEGGAGAFLLPDTDATGAAMNQPPLAVSHRALTFDMLAPPCVFGSNLCSSSVGRPGMAVSGMCRKFLSLYSVGSATFLFFCGGQERRKACQNLTKRGDGSSPPIFWGPPAPAWAPAGRPGPRPPL